MTFTLIPYSPEHQDFLLRLYTDTRRDEISAFGWTPVQQEAFFRMQFNAQQQWYNVAYAGADHRIILVDGAPIGRILVFRDAKANRLVDIALLSQFRGQGIGTQLLRELLEKSAQEERAVALQVLKGNPARHLYQRLGFVEIGEDEMYYQMEKAAASH